MIKIVMKRNTNNEKNVNSTNSKTSGCFSISGAITKGDAIKNKQDVNENIELILSVILIVFSAYAKKDGLIAEYPKPS